MMKDLQVELGLTYLFVSHDLGVIANISDRVAVMYAGRIVELGTTEAIFRNPRHPYTEALLEAIPGRGSGKRRDQVRLAGHVPDPTLELSGCSFAGRCPYAKPACTQITPPLEGELDHRYACIRAEELQLRPVVVPEPLVLV
jgi:peptide/nickel transport system ATP-binding protein